MRKKQCNRCQEFRCVRTEYYHLNGSTHGFCKICRSEISKEKYKADPEKAKEKARAREQRLKNDPEFKAQKAADAARWRERNPEKAREVGRANDLKRAKDPKRKEWRDKWYSKPEVHERFRERGRAKYQTPEGREAARVRNEEAVRSGKWDARRAVAEAERVGELVKDKCAQLSDECLGRLEWHHHKGYEKENWLEVICLCARHHRRIDAKK